MGHPARLGVLIEVMMVEIRAESMVGGTAKATARPFH